MHESDILLFLKGEMEKMKRIYHCKTCFEPTENDNAYCPEHLGGKRANWWLVIIMVFISTTILRVVLQNRGISLGFVGTVTLFAPFFILLYCKHRSFRNTNNFIEVSDEKYDEMMQNTNLSSKPQTNNIVNDETTVVSEELFVVNENDVHGSELATPVANIQNRELPICHQNLKQLNEQMEHNKKDNRSDERLSSPDKQTQKLRYCKMCGGKIDSPSRKCNDCGKQYFRFPAKMAIRIIVTVVVIALVGLNAFQYITANRLRSEVSSIQTSMSEKDRIIQNDDKLIRDQEQILSENDTQISDMRDLLSEIAATAQQYRSKASFMDRSVVIVPNDNTIKYHKYGCAYLDSSVSCWVYNPEAAKSLGYKACPYCN